MTKAQARRKWCPFVRIYAMGSRAYRHNSNSNDNLGLGLPAGSLCIGSDCMAWQRSTVIGPDRSPQIKANGHCGLINPSQPARL